ncbi:glycosyltransferase family 2 protein [Photobacterium galatheae]|uniref:Glycosyltransferase n=1 Tax=Photobacterium galatheae TaxID=1654360 RepID=A0A066RST5_9GAMM|nr:glycosyltransferase family 2 protein [Photobacterium galatheae]KDM90727.1 glycosyltransferase [Photobacterium galatheae]MCM0149943.1 glycosyltransferase family 2 protein [Photobacterium galatheae]
MKNIIVLIATTPRLPLLTENAIPSIINQTLSPTAVILISDNQPLTNDEVTSLKIKLRNIPLYTMTNSRIPGAAGSWNTGIDFISEHFPDSYIAMIDDDDRWHPEHLALCLHNSDSGTADVVLSGINVLINKEIATVHIPQNISLHDFLIGNPGWHGSNTFIKTELVTKVNGFTDGLISGNDRDFAIRVIESGIEKINYTHIATVDWICNQSPDALSASGSQQKLRGCAQFLQLHMHKMTSQDLESYFQRTHKLFSLSKTKILDELLQIDGKHD